MENTPPYGQIGKDGHEAPKQLKTIVISHSMNGELFNKASKKYKKIGYRSMQEYINSLIIKDTK